MIIKNFGVDKLGASQYIYALQKALWTYRTNDREFEKQIIEFQRVFHIIYDQLKVPQKLLIFKEDPYKMNQDNFEIFYKELIRSVIPSKEINEAEELLKPLNLSDSSVAVEVKDINNIS